MLWWSLRKLRIGNSSQCSDALAWFACHKSAKATARLRADAQERTCVCSGASGAGAQMVR